MWELKKKKSVKETLIIVSDVQTSRHEATAGVYRSMFGSITSRETCNGLCSKTRRDQNLTSPATPEWLFQKKKKNPLQL